MFPIHVTSAYPEGPGNFAAGRARQALTEGSIPGFAHTADPAAARAVLFLEHHPDSDPFFLAVLRHPLVRRFPEKCLLCHDHDLVVPFLPGFYSSLRRADLRPGVVESAIYLHQHCPNSAIRATPVTGAEPYLFSFVGAVRTHPVRRELLRLAGPEALIEDTSGRNGWELDDAARRSFHEHYARTLTDSRFVLCPRGAGPNSYRIYESMQAGRAPVIVSDDFAPPAGLPWADFALFVPEAAVDSLPRILNDASPRAAALGLAARRIWEESCSWPAGFARLCQSIRARTEAGATVHPHPLWKAAHRVATSSTAARLLVRSLRQRRAPAA